MTEFDEFHKTCHELREEFSLSVYFSGLYLNSKPNLFKANNAIITTKHMKNTDKKDANR